MSKPTVELEYRVRKVERFIVTRFAQDDSAGTGSVRQCGEYDNYDFAHEVAYALCKSEHETLGYSVGDERIQYPLKENVQSAQTGSKI